MKAIEQRLQRLEKATGPRTFRPFIQSMDDICIFRELNTGRDDGNYLPGFHHGMDGPMFTQPALNELRRAGVNTITVVWESAV